MAIETRRARPRLLEMRQGRYVEFDYDLQADPESSQPEVGVLRAMDGTVETQPRRAYDMLRLQQDDVPLATKQALDVVYRRSLSRGAPVEWHNDPSKLFLLAGDRDYDQRRHARMLAGSTYTLRANGGQYELGSIGSYTADPAGASRTNFVKNGDFEDGTFGATPTDWTNANTSTLHFERSGYYTAAGVLASCAKMYSKVGGAGGGTAYADMELDAEIDTVGVVSVSIKARADRAENSTATAVVTLRCGPADGSYSPVTIGTFTPKAKWRRYRFKRTLATATTDATLRFFIDVTSSTIQGAVYVTEVQVEPRSFCTGFVARSSVRTSLTGSRAANERIAFLNPLAYAHQIPVHTLSGRLGWTLDFWIEFDWQSGDYPAAQMDLVMDSHESSTHTPALYVFFDNTDKLNAQVRLDDGTTLALQSASGLTIAFGTLMHVAITYQDWDGTNNTGTLTSYVNGVQDDTAAHSSIMAGAGDILYIGGNPAGAVAALNANVGLNHVRIDGGYLDASDGWDITDYYDTDDPPDSERTAWRAVLRPGQGKPCREKNNEYELDLQLMESK